MIRRVFREKSEIDAKRNRVILKRLDLSPLGVNELKNNLIFWPEKADFLGVSCILRLISGQFKRAYFVPA